MKKTYTRRPRRQNRRRKVAKRKTPVHRGPFPVTAVAKMRWLSELVFLTATGGVLASRAFNVSSIASIDPVGSPTHQPFGYDQWSALYNHYVVLGAKVTARAVGNTTTVSAIPGCFGAYIADDTSAYTSYRSFIENKRGSWRMICNTSDIRSTVVSKYSPRKFFNIRDPTDNISRIGAAINASPSESAHVFVYWQPADEVTTSSLYVLVTVEQLVLFSERKDTAPS